MFAGEPGTAGDEKALIIQNGKGAAGGEKALIIQNGKTTPATRKTPTETGKATPATKKVLERGKQAP